MRQSILRILILALMLSAALGSFAQTPSTYIAEMKKLKDEYNVTFVYDSSLLLDASSRSVGSRQSLTRSLRDLFEGSGFRYELRGHTVIVLREGDRSPVDYEQPSAIFDTLRPSVIEGALHDTLRAARVEADRFVRRDAGTRIVALPEIRTMVSVTGEADAIKYVQTLPGVSTGAEGSSAIYVRGGNIGSNLTTIDGVALYGGSHLLGMTSAYPTDIVSSISFRMGGFHGDESNITASHIGLWTKDGNFTKKEYSVSVSTFILGGTVSMPLVKDKVSFIGSVRVSPLGPAFRAVQSAAGGALDSLSRPRAVIYDVFAKAKWLMDNDNSLSVSVFNSVDGYSYVYGGDSEESMGWNNFIVNARHEGSFRGWALEDGAAYNRFSGRQGIIRDMNGTLNNLAIVSSVDELTVDAVLSRSLGGGGDLRLGARERFAIFNPGTSSTFSGSGPLKPLDSPRSDHISHSSVTTVHGQWDLARDGYELMASARLNLYAADEALNPRWSSFFNPEGGLLAKADVTKWLAVEATADWTTQYYHTLEGIPVGWSVDLLVPTAPSRPPEHALQFYAGLFTSFGQHHITLGAYDKKMYNLVYFLDAGQLFSPAIAGWSSNIKVGTGTSRGVEFLYEKDGGRLDWRVAYTLSKTDRTFAEVNMGETFPAKFDRRHILNVTTSYTIADNSRRSIALTGLYTYQSGHWETVASGEILAMTLTGEEVVLDTFTGINNYEMPPYIRLDLGCSFTFKGKHLQTLNLGVYNVLNRHNPFSVIYDDRSREWRQVSLIPIMPSFSYRIQL